MGKNLEGIEMAGKDLFSLWDYVVLSLMLIGFASIGIYYRITGGKQKTLHEYLLADKNMSIIPVAFSLMASFMSAISLMGLTREIYTFGTQFIAINFGYILGTPLSAYLFLPVFFRQQSASAYAYLEKRFNYSTRIIASLAFSFQMVLYMGIVLYAPAIALEAVTGLSYYVSTALVGVVCTFYSTIGGMKAVLINDVFQSLLMFGSIFSVITAGVINVGGLSTVFSIARQGGRLQLFDLSFDPTVRHTFWSQTIGGAFLYVSLYGVNQTQVQRLLTIKDLKRSQWSLWVQWPILMLLSLSTSLAGLYIYAFYLGCDPIKSHRIDRPDQLMPLIVVDTLGQFPGLAGLFVAGIFSGSLSTISSAINSLAAVTLEDYIKPFLKVPMAEDTSSKVIQAIALGFGLLTILFSFLATFIGPGVLQASLSVFGIIGGPLLGLFTLGMFVPFAKSLGAIAGFSISIPVLFWMSFGQPRPVASQLPLSTDQCHKHPFFFNSTVVDQQAASLASEIQNSGDFFYLYKVSYAWYTLIGWLLVMVVGILVSALLKSEPTPDPDLFADCIRNKLKSQLNCHDQEVGIRLIKVDAEINDTDAPDA